MGELKRLSFLLAVQSIIYLILSVEINMTEFLRFAVMFFCAFYVGVILIDLYMKVRNEKSIKQD